MNFNNYLDQKTLDETFINITKNHHLLETMPPVELQALRVHLSEKYSILIKKVIRKAPTPLDPKGTEYVTILLNTKDKTTNHNARYIKSFINRIDKITIEERMKVFNGAIFPNTDSQAFFNCHFLTWLRYETSQNTVHFLYRTLWYKNTDTKYYRSDNYFIIGKFKLFAEYWNTTHLFMCKTSALRIKRTNLRTFSEIGDQRCEDLTKKIKGLEPQLIEATKNTPKLP